VLRVRDLGIRDGGRRYLAKRLGKLAALGDGDDRVVLPVQYEKRWRIGRSRLIEDASSYTRLFSANGFLTTNFCRNAMNSLRPETLAVNQS